MVDLKDTNGNGAVASSDRCCQWCSSNVSDAIYHASVFGPQVC